MFFCSNKRAMDRTLLAVLWTLNTASNGSPEVFFLSGGVAIKPSSKDGVTMGWGLWKDVSEVQKH